MNLWKRLFRPRSVVASELEDWRKAWARAAGDSASDVVALAGLRARLDQLSGREDVEIEREMLDGLEQALSLTSAIKDRGLPALATGHRVVGTDTCHFIAPASMPDDAAQPSGRLLLTNARAIFVGGGRGLTVAWHALARPAQTERDLVLVRRDGSALYRFRCNSYGDALCAAVTARHLVQR
jgi:hypothetical protein